METIIRLNCALDLERKAVGVKFLHTEEEYQLAAAKTITEPINYCVMVRLATQGRATKAIGNNLACLAGARALGLKEIDAYHRSGQNGKKLGLYNDMPTAKRTRDGMSYCDHQAFGIMVKPLEDYDSEPDVVIIVSTPYNIMRIVQGYSYYNGMQSNFKMTGNQAVCSESTAYPYLSNDINASLLCIGTRHQAGWSDHELAVGFPIGLFTKIVDGIMNTVNIMENNQKKEVIEKKLLANGIGELKIKYDFNYYR
ncbi:DUF169 domain-containing protein [Sporomusa aerivorans]|uniref:DUF169 domain-containing protein n=1 Tax=Sporomusa aerivorans TaxID=204936 RepID=UPI00352ABAF1